MVFQTKTERLMIERERRRSERRRRDPRFWEGACTLTVLEPKKKCFVAVETWKPRRLGVPCQTGDDFVRAFEVLENKFPSRPSSEMIIANFLPRGQAKEAIRVRRCIYDKR